MQIGEFTPDNLIAGDFPRVTAQITLASGNFLKRGYIITSAGAQMATGGDPFAVVAETTDTRDGRPATQVPIYLSGEFAREHLQLGGGAPISAADQAKLRALNIYVKDTVPAV
jgi:hypothetical protein